MGTNDGRRILVTGALGQIGTELVISLRECFGNEYVISSDINKLNDDEENIHLICDVTDKSAISVIIEEYNIGEIYHLAALLSATGEKNPELCYNVNMNGLLNVLELAKEYGLKVFAPSSIAVFGPDTPPIAPQAYPLNPTTMYGITKVAGELLADYYHREHGVDVRGLRYPGLISWKMMPGGGTTDYAVEIFYEAIVNGKYTCFVESETCLPMMYMDDAIRATLELMSAPLGSLSHHSNYNLGAMSFTAKELAESIQKLIPDFEITYNPDYRQSYADSWPDSIDDTTARLDWGWEPQFDLEATTEIMLENLRPKLEKIGIHSSPSSPDEE